MSWCDKLASVPTIGVRLSPLLVPGDFILRAITPAILRMTNNDIGRLNMEEHTTFGVKFGTPDGFKVGIDSRKVHVGFQHQMRAVPTSGGPPVMQMLSTPRPYSEILTQSAEFLERIVAEMPDSRDRHVERIGVVSLTSIDEADLPPGISRYVAFQQKPWEKPLDHYTLTTSVAIVENDKWLDRCIHSVIKPDDKEALMTLQFDWGREYKTPKRFDHGSLHSDVNHCIESAISYFEELAEGQRFDV